MCLRRFNVRLDLATVTVWRASTRGRFCGGSAPSSISSEDDPSGEPSGREARSSINSTGNGSKRTQYILHNISGNMKMRVASCY